MSLSQLAELACNKRLFSEIDQVVAINQPPTMEPAEKKVRFDSNAAAAAAAPADPTPVEKCPRASSPQELEKLMEKVRRRAQLRKARSSRSPPPPPPSAVATATFSPSDESSSSSSSFDEGNHKLAAMQRKLSRMEQAIKKSACMELQLMNKSKKLRDQRARLTDKYESMAQQLVEMQRSQERQAVLFQMGRLPPLMAQTRRVSATQDQIVHIDM